MSTNNTAGDPSVFVGNIIGTGPGNYTTIYDSTWSSPTSVDLKNNPDFKDLQSKISKIEERLAILVPNDELQKRFPALQEAYDHYKLIEKLVNDQISKE